MSKSVKSIVVISAIALVCGLLLALVYQLTKPSDDQVLKQELKTLQEIHKADYEIVYHDFTPEGAQQFKYMFKAKGEDYYIIKSSGTGYGGAIEVYVSISNESVVNLHIGNHSETPGIFDSSLETLDSFYLSLDKIFKLKSDGGDIDVKASATAVVSNRGIANAVDYAVQYYMDYKDIETEEPFDIMDVLNEIHEAEYEIIEHSYTITKEDGTKIVFANIYKAKNEDYYIIVSEGNGHSVRSSRGNDIPLEVYVSISSNKVVGIYIGENEETPKYLNHAIENKDKFLLPVDSVFMLKADGGDIDANLIVEEAIDDKAAATNGNSSRGIAEALAYATDYYLDYTGDGISALRMAKLKSIQDNDYELIPHKYDIVVDEDATVTFKSFYKAIGKDYYIIIANGNGHSVRSSRGNDTPLEVYVSISENKVVAINIGENAETAKYLNHAIENKDKFLLPVDSVFMLKADGGDIDADLIVEEAIDDKAAATNGNSSRGIAEALAYATDYYLDYTGDGISALRMSYLNALKEAEYEVIKYSYTITNDDNDDYIINYMYKAIGEDYYIIVANGAGRNGPIQVFAATDGNSIVDILIGAHSESGSRRGNPPYIDQVINDENTEKFLLPLTSIFKVADEDGEGGDIDATAGATMTADGIAEALAYAAEYFLNYMED